MKKLLTLFLFITVISTLAWGAIIINNKLIEMNSYTSNGIIFVPVTELARAMGAKVLIDPSGNINISTSLAGGAYEIKGVEGSIGQTLFNGITRFMVKSVAEAELDPLGSKPLSGGKFILVSVKVKNGSKKARDYGYAMHRITLVDDKGQLYSTDAMKQEKDWIHMVGLVSLVPGGEVNGTYIFEVPIDAKAIRVVFEPREEKTEKAFRVNVETK